MLRIHKASELVGKHAYTSEGDYFGQIEEVNLEDNKVAGWKIRVGGGFISLLGGARGVIIPHQFVKAIGDVFIVNKTSLPAGGGEVEGVGENTEEMSSTVGSAAKF